MRPSLNNYYKQRQKLKVIPVAFNVPIWMSQEWHLFSVQQGKKEVPCDQPKILDC